MTFQDPNKSDLAAHPERATVAARILGHLRNQGDKTFLRFVDASMKVEELSFRDFFLHAMVTASLYDHFEVPVGGTVILVLSNPRDVFLAEAGALLTGRVPIVSAHPSPKLSLGDFGRTLLPLIDNAEPGLIVGDQTYCSYLSAAIGRRVASLDDIVVPKQLPAVVSTDSSTLFIQYSSGTTGTKKGVSISQQQLLWQVDAYAREIGLRPDDHIVSWLPYYHDMGLLTALMMPLLTGTPVTVMSPFDWVKNPLMLLRAISRHRGTLTWLPNFAYNFLAQASQRADLSDVALTSLRGVVNCSEPVSATSHDLFLKAFVPRGLDPGALAASYAMAETTFAITSGGFGRSLKVEHIERSLLNMGATVAPGPHPVVSSGRILPGTDVQILGADHEALVDRRVGEIAVRSPSLMGGYFKNPEASAQAYVGGYFLTGDLGYRDGQDLFVTGRIKDLIITAGRNIYPQDIETIVNDIPQVIDGRCVAFGIADDSKGTENVVIVAERKSDSTLDAKQLAQTISQAVTARFDIGLADVLVVAPGWLKKSTSGKIARSQNRERYLDLEQTSAPIREVDPSSIEDVVRGCIHKTVDIWVEDDQAPLVTSGIIDSLALTNLMLNLEDAFKKSMPMPDEAGYDAYDSITAIAQVVRAETRAKAPPFILVIDRQIKANYVLEGPRNFDTLILGSSRSYLIRAKRAAKYGLRAFQFAVASARVEEFYCMVQFFKHANRGSLKHVIIGADPIQFSPHLPIDIRLEKSANLFAFLDESDRLNQGEIKLDDVNLAQKSERLAKLMQMRYSAFDVDLAFDHKTGDVVKLFGRNVVSMPLLRYSTEKSASQWTQQFLTANEIDHLHPHRLYYLEKLMRLISELDCKLTIYTNPLHPLMTAQLKERTPYMTTQDQLVKHLRSSGYGNVTVHPFVTPADFGGDDADFFDGVHMGRHNGDKLLDYLLAGV